MLSTRTKIALARLANRGINPLRALVGRDHMAAVRRRGINWSLDLREGIDFAIYLTGSFEPSTLAAYRRLLSEGDVAVDIGANMGAHTLHLAKCVAATGRVLAYEPTVSAFARLKRNIACNPDLAPRITAVQAMLVAESGADVEPEIYASWPLHTPSGAHPLHLGVLVSTEGARSLTLDEAIAELGVRRVHLIKLDVDGHELEVLSGARTTLARHRPRIIMELAPYTLEERGQDYSMLLSIFGDLGYRFQDLGGRPLEKAGRPVPEIPAGYGMNVIAVP